MRKKLLMLVMLLTVAVSGAWADEWEIDFTNPSPAADVNVTITETKTVSGTNMGTCASGGTNWNSNFVLQVGTAWLHRSQSRGLYQFNTGGRSMGMLNCTAGQIITIEGSGDPNPVTNVTLLSFAGTTYKYTVNADGDVKFTPARYLYFYKISVEDPVPMFTFTVNAVTSNGSVIKALLTDPAATENQNYTLFFPKYLTDESGRVTHVKADNNFTGSFTATASNATQSVVYNAYSREAYFFEGESFAGFISKMEGLANCSNGKSGRGLNNATIDVMTIPSAGIWKVNYGAYSNHTGSARQYAWYKNSASDVLESVSCQWSVNYVKTTGTRSISKVLFEEGDVLQFYAGDTQIALDYVMVEKLSEALAEEDAITRIWDFSQFPATEAEYAADYETKYKAPYDYNDLTLDMGYNPGKCFITSKGFSVSGATIVNNVVTDRYMDYMPFANGTLRITYLANNDNNIAAIGTALESFTDINSAPESVVGCGYSIAATPVIISAPVERGKQYFIYFAAGGGQRITKVTYIPDGAAPMYQSTLDFQSLAAEDVELITEADLTEIVDMTITDASTASKMVVSGSDTGTPNHFAILGEGASQKAVLELNGGTLTFTPQDGRSLKKITIYYDTWDEGNGELIEGESVPLEVDGSKKTAVWSGSSQLVVIGITGKTVIKRIVIEVGERKDAAGIIDIPTGKDIYKEVSAWQEKNPYASGLTINLEENGKYTTSGSLFIGRPLCINGAEGAVIDASKCEDPFILMRPIGDNASLNAAGGYDVDSIAIKNVTIKGLKNRLVYADRHQYLIGKVLVSNSVIMVDGTTPRSIFDFYCGGNFKELIVENSTLAADPSNSKRGGLLSTQASQSVFALGGENQKISIKNSTLYNIAKGETPVLLERHSDADLTFELLNSIIVNSGEAGKFVLGLNEGQPGEECTWIIGNNSFTFDGKDTGRDEQYGNADVVEGPITFSGADKGDFSLSVLDAAFEAGIGDPRWLNGAEGDLLVEVASGKDIAAEVAAAKGDKKPLNTLIRLAKDGKYTISGTIESAGNIVIKGDGTGLPTIDATALDAPFVTLDGTETAAKNVDGTENANYKSIGQVKITDLKIEGLSKPLVRDNQKTLVDNLQVQNAVVNMEGSANIFDFNGKGYPAALRVLESTLWSKGGHTGFFLQSSGRVKDLDGDQSQYTQMITVAFSTLYKISVGKQLNNLQGKGQKSLVLMLMNSIIAESTQAGNEVRGWLGGQNSTNPQALYLCNSYWANGAVQAGWTDSSKQGYDMSETSLEGDPQFKNPAEGDFTLGAGTEQNQYGIGDPRWTVEYVPTAIEAVQTVKENANDGAWYTLQGVRVDKPAKGIYIHNGKKVVIK
ncbi:MAG: DUF4957 domain-containing protein [Prevotella sp.]|nr:DUF4957 domain-containing protein [Prevotella sp.]